MSQPFLSQIQRSSSLVEEVGSRLSIFIRSAAAEGVRSLPSERDLAERFGVSRPVVREAIKRLELQGLVEIKQGLGTIIVDKLHKPLIGSLMILVPDEADRLSQLNETRLAIEPMAAWLAAQRASDEDVTRLWDLHKALKEASDSNEAIDTDLQFHRMIADCSGNLMFRLILDSLAEIGRASRRLTIGRLGKEKAIDHHRPIISAIEDRRADAASEAMRHHIEAAGRDMQLESYGR